MNFLQNASVVCRRAVFALMIIASLFVVASAQKECKSYGCPGFVGEPINLKVVNADIRDILNYITEQYGINFVIDGSIKQVPVTVNVNEVPWNVALDSVLQSQGLSVQINGTILRVADSKTLALELTINRQLIDSRLDGSPLYTEFIRLNYARAAGEEERIKTKTGTSTDVGDRQDNETKNEIETQQVNSGLLPIVRRRLSRRGAIEVDGRSNTLIVTDVRENIDAIRQLVSILDQPEPQVEIETRIVVATRNFSRDIGVQLAAAVGIGTDRFGSGSTLPTPKAEDGAFQDIPLGLNGAPQPTNDLQSSIRNTVIGLTTGIFGTAQISMLITAGEQKGQAKIIATPRVTTLNNRTAEISSGTKIPVTTVQPGDGGSQPIYSTEYVDVPLRLAVTPQITDVGTVVLKVIAENSSASIGLNTLAPAINSQTMNTEVLVPDGGTTVVGGVLFDDERESQDRTPGLSRIPLLGNLFKRKGVSRNTNEILFFITPRIYRTDYNGNIISGKVGNGNRTQTILQPVPLGNPESNSTPNTNRPQMVVPSTPETNPAKQP